MPTEYTSDIYNGKDISFKEFTLNCAKAFGAFMHMRDETLNKDIIMSVASSYHIDRINELKEKLSTVDNIEIDTERDYNIALEEYNREVIKNIELSERYDDMINKVNEWMPPTDKHKNLKEFMREQLIESKKNDIYNPLMPKYDKRDIDIIRNEIKLEIQKQIDYHKEMYLKKVKRIEDAKKWTNVLLDSFS